MLRQQNWLAELPGETIEMPRLWQQQRADTFVG